MSTHLEKQHARYYSNYLAALGSMITGQLNFSYYERILKGVAEIASEGDMVPGSFEASQIDEWTMVSNWDDANGWHVSAEISAERGILLTLTEMSDDVYEVASKKWFMAM
ncbi:MAG: hypothetical protein ACREHG_03955 [Candidatus Saccharimonadales bacterium]